MELLDNIAIFAGVQLRLVVRSLLTYLSLNVYPDFGYGIFSLELPAGRLRQLLSLVIPYQTLDVFCWGTSCRIYNWDATFLPRLLLSGNLENWRAFLDTAWLSNDLKWRTTILALVIILAGWFAISLLGLCFSPCMMLVGLLIQCCLFAVHLLILSIQCCYGMYELVAATIALRQAEQPCPEEEREPEHDTESYTANNVQEVGHDKKEVSANTPTMPVEHPLNAKTELTPNSRASREAKSFTESHSSPASKAECGPNLSKAPESDHRAQEQTSPKPKSVPKSTKPRSTPTGADQDFTDFGSATFNMGSPKTYKKTTSDLNSHSSPPKQSQPHIDQEKQQQRPSMNTKPQQTTVNDANTDSSPPLHTRTSDTPYSKQTQPSKDSPDHQKASVDERKTDSSLPKPNQPRDNQDSQRKQPTTNRPKPQEGPISQQKASSTPLQRNQQSHDRGSQSKQPNINNTEPQEVPTAKEKPSTSAFQQKQETVHRHSQQQKAASKAASGTPERQTQASGETGPPLQAKQGQQPGPRKDEQKPGMNNARPQEGPKHQRETFSSPRKQSQQPDSQGSQEQKPSSGTPKPHGPATGEKTPPLRPKQAHQPEARDPQQHQSGTATSSPLADSASEKRTHPSQPKPSSQSGPQNSEQSRPSTPKQQYKPYRPGNTPPKGPRYKPYRPDHTAPEQPRSPPGKAYYQQQSSYHSYGHPYGKNTCSDTNSSYTNPNFHGHQNTGNGTHNHSSHTRQDQYQQHQQPHPSTQLPTNPPPIPRFNPYTTLSIPPTATAQEIQRAFRKASLAHHPDKVAGCDPSSKAAAEAAMKDINRANTILRDPTMRMVYDLVGLELAENGAYVEGFREHVEEERRERERRQAERMWEGQQGQRQGGEDASGNVDDGLSASGAGAGGSGSGNGRGNDGGFQRWRPSAGEAESRTARRMRKQREDQQQQEQRQ